MCPCYKNRLFESSFFSYVWRLVFWAMILSQLLTILYFLLNEDTLVDRQYSHSTAAMIRAYWQADEDQRDILARAMNMRAHTPNEAPKLSESHWPYTQIFSKQLKKALGEQTQTIFQIESTAALWVYAPHLGDDWLEIKLYSSSWKKNKLLRIMLWLMLILTISSVLSYVFIRYLNDPFSRLVLAARNLGQGHYIVLDVNPHLPSEIKELYHTFNKMIDDIKKNDRERKIMLAGVSHDLRTPLTRIHLGLSLLKNAANEQQIADIIGDLNEANNIVEQFIHFVREDEKDPVLSDINQLITEVCTPYNQQIHLDIKPLRDMRIYPDFFKRMLINLIENALKYGDNYAEIIAYNTNKSLIIKILDNGQGIDDDLLDKVFTPFVRGDKSRNQNGSGLGLAIVKKICIKHHGKIELFNRQQGGLEARITLPIT